MNDKIQEIARQAGFYANPDVEKFEKFAELIVRECAGVGYEASYSECALNVSNKILEHFGVKE
jgi:hypothetical protein